jgi:hypothetical protein
MGLADWTDIAQFLKIQVRHYRGLSEFVRRDFPDIFAILEAGFGEYELTALALRKISDGYRKKQLPYVRAVPFAKGLFDSTPVVDEFFERLFHGFEPQNYPSACSSPFDDDQSH